MDISIHIPENCEQYAADIKRFVDAMVFKLRKNAHKGRWEDLGTEDAMSLLEGEVGELYQALRGTPNAFDVIFEAADVANFALMVSSIVTEKARVPLQAPSRDEIVAWLAKKNQAERANIYHEAGLKETQDHGGDDIPF